MNFIDKKIRTTCESLKGLINRGNTCVSDVKFIKVPYKTSNTIPDESENWQSYDGKDLMAGKDEHFWFVFEIDVPTEENIEYRLGCQTARNGWDAANPQCTVFIDGETAYQAFDTNHTDTPVSAGHHKVAVYYYTGMIPGITLAKFALSAIDLRVESLYYDLFVPYSALGCLKWDSDDYITILNALDKATQLLDLRESYSDEFYASLEKCREFMKSEFYEKECGKSGSTIGVFGHTHIDVAWLWTIAQTKEKAQRSFSTVLRLMEKYPEYVFMSSQPQLFAYVKENDPELYAKIKEKVKEGRFEVDGAMWLEADTNVPSGESLVRQILYGKRFMREEFGAENEMLWLPDVFGYSGALPQILKKSGVDKFYTAKLFWNEMNKPEHDLFVWQGIDGSEVFAHLNDTYVKKLDPGVVSKTWMMHKDKKYSNIHTSTFGYGDGGGGPTAEMIENFRRMKDGLPGFPKLVMQKAKTTIEESKRQFEENCKALKFTPKWIGELYFEFHRGTYTSQANNKKNNRLSELSLAKAEALAVVDKLTFGSEYPKAELYGAWIKTLRNQFHDIIPGSSINEVYRDSDIEYSEILSTAKSISDSALERISGAVNTDGGLFVYNPSPFEFTGVAETENGPVYLENVSAHGYKIASPCKTGNVVAEGKIIENDLIRVEFNDKYEIISIYDKRSEREVIGEGERGNVLEVYEDMPYEYDAWDISEYYTQKRWEISDVVSVTPINLGLKAGFRVERKYGRSSFVQNVTLSEKSARLDFETEVDWNEQHSLLKAAFNTSIHTQRANYEIQFGHLDRPTHKNTPVDRAKFEVCAHKWADLSERGYGVSLLNNSKYGYSASEGKISISLLRAPKYPDAKCDIGKHKFTYSLFMHEGELGIDTIKEAYKLNSTLEIKELKAQRGTLPASYSFVENESRGFVVETVKAAEDGDGYVIRGYESLGGRDNVKLTFAHPFKSAELIDLRESKVCDLEIKDGCVKFTAKPFEIITLKVMQ